MLEKSRTRTPQNEILEELSPHGTNFGPKMPLRSKCLMPAGYEARQPLTHKKGSRGEKIGGSSVFSRDGNETACGTLWQCSLRRFLPLNSPVSPYRIIQISRPPYQVLSDGGSSMRNVIESSGLCLPYTTSRIAIDSELLVKLILITPTLHTDQAGLRTLFWASRERCVRIL